MQTAAIPARITDSLAAQQPSAIRSGTKVDGLILSWN
jgi:hypothetical protein